MMEKWSTGEIDAGGDGGNGEMGRWNSIRWEENTVPHHTTRSGGRTRQGLHILEKIPSQPNWTGVQQLCILIEKEPLLHTP